MKFEELLDEAWHTGQLKPSHVLFPFEDKLLSVLSGKKGERAVHDLEHRDMLNHWNIPFKDEVTFELSHLDGKPNRVWHMLLHFKYWKEMGLNPELLQELKTNHPEINLNDIPLPRAIGDQNGKIS